MSRNDWDEGFSRILEELRQEEQRELITSAAIAGRLSMLVAAQDAMSEGLTFNQFLEVMQTIVDEEVNAGKVDETTFKIPENLTDDNDGLS